jgi:ABC-type transport system involved in cytochrome bd biosynthesis fused ATPase/permease subunit
MNFDSFSTAEFWAVVGVVTLVTLIVVELSFLRLNVKLNRELADLRDGLRKREIDELYARVNQLEGRALGLPDPDDAEAEQR